MVAVAKLEFRLGGRAGGPRSSESAAGAGQATEL